jgi:hypothetical protein
MVAHRSHTEVQVHGCTVMKTLTFKAGACVDRGRGRWRVVVTLPRALSLQSP